MQSAATISRVVVVVVVVVLLLLLVLTLLLPQLLLSSFFKTAPLPLHECTLINTRYTGTVCQGVHG